MLNIKGLQKSRSSKRLVLFGEIHGTEEIPQIIVALLSRMAFDVLFLEIPRNEQVVIDKYLSSGLKKDLLKSVFFRAVQIDGRGGIAYQHLITNVRTLMLKREKKLRIICVDLPSLPFLSRNKRMAPLSAMNSRDKQMCEKIMRTKFSRAIFVCGSVHASLIPIKLPRGLLKTTGTLLNKQISSVTSIKFVPKSGTYYNFGVKKIIIDNRLTDNQNVIFSNKKRTGYDLFILLPHTSASL